MTLPKPFPIIPLSKYVYRYLSLIKCSIKPKTILYVIRFQINIKLFTSCCYSDRHLLNLNYTLVNTMCLLKRPLIEKNKGLKIDVEVNFGSI